MKVLAVFLGLNLLWGCTAAQEVLLAGDRAAGPSARFVQAYQNGAPQMQLSVEQVRAAGIVVLDVNRDGTETWLSPEGASFVLRAGLLVGTRGLGGDMLASDVAQTSALLSAKLPGQAHRFHTFIDGQDNAVTRTFICNVTVTGARTIAIVDRNYATVLMSEDCASPDLQFVNLYWVSTTSSQILQSRQWASAATGPLALRPIPQ